MSDRHPKRVKFIGASDDQVRYSSRDDPRNLLITGAIYLVDRWQEDAFITHVQLIEVPGRWFNSVCFEAVPKEQLTENRAYRERLVEVMAEALCPKKNGAKLRRVGVELELEEALAAAERAGFEFRNKEASDG